MLKQRTQLQSKYIIKNKQRSYKTYSPAQAEATSALMRIIMEPTEEQHALLEPQTLPIRPLNQLICLAAQKVAPPWLYTPQMHLRQNLPEIHLVVARTTWWARDHRPELHQIQVQQHSNFTIRTIHRLQGDMQEATMTTRKARQSAQAVQLQSHL